MTHDRYSSRALRRRLKVEMEAETTPAEAETGVPLSPKQKVEEAARGVGRLVAEEGERGEEGVNIPTGSRTPEGGGETGGRGRAVHSPPTLVSKVAQAFLTTPLYPIRFVHVLIQLGHEPVPPQRRYSLVFRRYMYYWPGIIGYARAIIKQDGWRELYRGLWGGLTLEVVSILSSALFDPLIKRAVQTLPLSVVPSNGDQPDNEDNIQTTRAVAVRAVRLFLHQIFLKSIVIVVIQPFYTISVRMIAQHIGKEALYSNMWRAVREIYREEGISGFYKGTIPALLGGLVTTLMYTSLWMGVELVSNIIPQQWGKVIVKNMVGPFMLSYIPSSYAYPFTLMRTMMAVNNSRLAAGSPPRAPLFDGWVDCYRYLRLNNLTYRGSVIYLPRYAYTRPPVE